MCVRERERERESTFSGEQTKKKGNWERLMIDDVGNELGCEERGDRDMLVVSLLLLLVYLASIAAPNLTSFLD